MTTDPKDTIYIDVDDEITAIIDKLKGSPKKIVALVLPKRASVFQSVVNMKLLKRTAEEQKKNVVLVTSEAALLPLAGAVGMHVAKTPQSKPYIPPAPGTPGFTVHQDGEETPVHHPSDDEEDDAIEVDNSESDAPAAAAAAGGAAAKMSKAAKKAGGKKKFKIPNFEKFRSKLFLGIAALVLLIIGSIFAFFVLPKATITLKTDTTNLDTNLPFTVDTGATEADIQNVLLPGISKEFRKTDTEKVAATGQKDVGTKAAGSVTLTTACSSTVPTIPAGTSVSTNNLAFATDQSVTLSPAVSGGNCVFRGTVGVTAQAAGEQYNVPAGRTFAVAGYSSVSGNNADAMAGGTSKIIKVVTQQDVDSAKQRITERAASEAPEELEQDIQKENHKPLRETMTTGNPTITSTPNVGDEAAEVTVTSTTQFTMLGIKEDDLKKLVEEDAKKRIDTSKQMIQDNGLGDATIRQTARKSPAQATMAVQTIVVAGPELDSEGIKKEIAGKKRGEVQSIIKQRPGIQDVEVAYSPFWVQSTPKSTSKIKIVFEKK